MKTSVEKGLAFHLSITCLTYILVSIEKVENLNIQFLLPETMFLSSRCYSSVVELGEDRIAKFEDEVLSLRQCSNMTTKKTMKKIIQGQISTHT